MLLLCIAGPALADKYGIDESMGSMSSAGGDGLIILLKWSLIGAGAGFFVAWAHNQSSNKERLDLVGPALLGGFLGMLLSLPLHILFD